MRPSLLLLVVGGLLFGSAGLAAAAEQDSCFTCHEKSLFQDQVIHEPVKSGKCSICHNPHVARYKGLLRYEKGKLCYTCHQEKAESFKTGIVHEPINLHECTACHEPHAASGKGLVARDLKARCLACHGPREENDKIIPGLAEKYKHTHQPYLEGECGACHQPHNSERPMLLTKAPDELCGSCHAEGELQAKHTGYPGTLRGCLTCHNPHGSDRPALIRNVLHEPYEQGCDSCHEQSSGRVSVEKCGECHAEAFGEMLASHTHLTRRDGNVCVNCHSPHAGDEQRLLRARQKQVCAACHRESIDKYKNSAFKHGKNIDNCVDCHHQHGGNDMALLKGNGLEVCALCHENQGKFTHPVGPEVPDPRTGRMITCITCHNPMGTDYPYNLILDGKQQLCVQCHKEY